MHHTQNSELTDKNQKAEFQKTKQNTRTLDFKIQRQTVVNTNIASVASQKTRRKLYRKLFERIKESKIRTSMRAKQT